MRRISKHTYAEIYTMGCNPGFVATSDGVVMIDAPQRALDAMRWKERMLEHGPIRYLINTEPHGDHTIGNAYFPGVTVVGQVRLKACFQAYIDRFGGGPSARHEKARTEDPDSAWLMEHPDYPPYNPPSQTFNDQLQLHVGNHTIHCIHMPGHTTPQTSVFLPDEGVVFTGDNVFCKCQTWLQEANPWLWLDALKAIDQLDIETIVPGHGEPCSKAYLQQQADIIQQWLGVAQRCLDAGMTEDEAAAYELDVKREIDPYPMGQRLEEFEHRLKGMNLRNLYRQLRIRQQGGSGDNTAAGGGY